MKIFFLSLLLLITAINLSAFSQERPGITSLTAPIIDSTKQVHDFLSIYAGEWNEEIDIWMKADSLPYKIPAYSKNIMSPDTILRSDQECHIYGNVIKTVNILTYSPANKNFTLKVVDNVGSGELVTTGGWDKAFYTIILTGQTIDPNDDTFIYLKHIIKFINDDKYIIETYEKQWKKELMGDSEYKTIERIFTRKK